MGSAHVVIVIILVIALIGALGFIFWQNFVSKTSDNQTNSTTSAQKERANEDNSTLKQPKLAIREWGVGGDYSNDAVKLTYSIEGAFIHFRDSRLKNTDCESAGLTIARYKGNEEAAGNVYAGSGLTVKEAYERDLGSNRSPFVAHVGEYYFMTFGASLSCALDDESLAQSELDVLEAAKEVIESLRAI